MNNTKSDYIIGLFVCGCGMIIALLSIYQVIIFHSVGSPLIHTLYLLFMTFMFIILLFFTVFIIVQLNKPTRKHKRKKEESRR